MKEKLINIWKICNFILPLHRKTKQNKQTTDEQNSDIHTATHSAPNLSYVRTSQCVRSLVQRIRINITQNHFHIFHTLLS